MTSRIPGPADPFEEEGQASQEPGLAGKRITGDPQDDMVVPAADRPVAAEDYGTTAAEQRDGEPLDVRIAREEPDMADRALDESADSADPYPVDRDERAGRLVESDEGAREDVEAEAVAHSVGTDSGGFSAEERAMHVEPEA
jgi:hypothetical protein